MKILHHNDNDGRLAAYIVARRAVQGPIAHNPDMFIEMTYNKPVPLDKILKGETVWIVDFSISPEDMKRLLDITPNVLWIDHHASAIKRYEDWDGPRIEGWREVGTSGCMLTWQYLAAKATNDMAPEWVKLVDDYDVWTFKYGDRTRDFFFGVMGEQTEPGPGCIWEQLYEQDADVLDIVNAGKTIRSYLKTMYEEQVKDYAYVVTYKGFNTIVLNTANRGSTVFGLGTRLYDLCVTTTWNGQQWKLGFYSEKEHVDCTSLAMELGGGGHKGAAGAFVDALPEEFGKLSRQTSDAVEIMEDMYGKVTDKQRLKAAMDDIFNLQTKLDRIRKVLDE